ncbi:autophagy-related protein 16-1 [Biomphalaria pfeifferi]|uniref:Autophagy-related protein 16-1 n=1 Tax=Biomphalaria pfeifferi TaxID=112525 RepID=A0AAD8BJ91_BIOPF|nr:autophagy-related protein 16-1 [Biomphalaria pfeifferi]
MATDTNWKRDLLNQIQRRNRKQSYPFIHLIQTNNKLQEIASSLHLKNVQLQVEIERLKEESIGSHVRGDGVVSIATTHQLEQKLFKLQEELTEMHKKRGENAQQIIDLNALLQEKEKEIQHKDTMISSMVETNVTLKQSKKALEFSISELEATNQMLKDEHQALQMAFTALEERYRKTQEDNSDLIQRWMEQKAKDADRMNAENADFIKARQQRLAKDLEEAAKEQVPVDLDKGPVDGYIPAVCVMASVPSRAQCVFDAHEGEVYSVQWNAMGSFFASGGADRKIKLWEYHNGVCESRGTLVGSNAGITSLDYSQDDSMLLGASNDFASRIWTVVDQRLRHTLTGHSGKVLSAKFLTEGKVVSGSHDRTLKIWDLVSKSCVKTIFAGSSCNDLVTLYGASIISGHFDKRIRFWDTRGPADSSINEILLQGRLTSLALASDKNQLLCCTRDDCLKIIDLRMNQVSCTLTADGFKVGCDWSRAVFSPDREYAAAGSGDGHLFVWNVSKAKVEKILKEHSHAVVACSWNPSGVSLVSCEKGKKVVLWSDF